MSVHGLSWCLGLLPLVSAGGVSDQMSVFLSAGHCFSLPSLLAVDLVNSLHSLSSKSQGLVAMNFDFILITEEISNTLSNLIMGHNFLMIQSLI